MTQSRFDLLNPLSADQRTIAERKWRSNLKPRREQEPCDVGLFSDDKLQEELNLVVEMFQDVLLDEGE